MRNQRKISTLIVHRIQREVGLLVVVILMITTISVAFLTHWTLEEAIRQANPSPVSGGAVETLLIFKRALLDRIFISLLVSIFVIGFVVVKALHRVVGPLSRISETLKAMGEGRAPKEISLRQGDYFLELAEEVNSVIRRFHTLHPKPGRDRI